MFRNTHKIAQTLLNKGLTGREGGVLRGAERVREPEDYGSRAIPLEDFKAVLEEELAHHNARPGRRSEVAMGRSFNEVFNEGYARATIRRATDEQLRLWLLRAEGIRAKRDNGALKLYDTEYWSDWMYRIAGEKVVARFDADDLAAGLEVYDLKGRYLGHAECRDAAPFLSVDHARDHNRKRGAWLQENGMVTMTDHGEFVIAEATMRGIEIARGEATHPEIQRPRARRL